MSAIGSLAAIPLLVGAHAYLLAGSLIALPATPVDCPTFTKSPKIRRLDNCFGTPGRTRTGTSKKLDFESSASTNSATGALGRERGD
jgi:hypothetical protein